MTQEPCKLEKETRWIPLEPGQRERLSNCETDPEVIGDGCTWLREQNHLATRTPKTKEHQKKSRNGQGENS